MDQFIEDEGKLGHGFTSADELEKIDLEMEANQGRHTSLLN
jgi:hypothetical protein